MANSINTQLRLKISPHNTNSKPLIEITNPNLSLKRKLNLSNLVYCIDNLNVIISFF